MTTNLKGNYTNPEGFWNVTTEGDCEGRSTRDLGTHFGFVDEIAFALADKCYYSLCFKSVEPYNMKVPTKSEVNISFDHSSATWDMSVGSRKKFVEKLLEGRDVEVKEGQYYASVKLLMGKTNEERQHREKEMLKLQALAKLSKTEREALGFI